MDSRGRRKQSTHQDDLVVMYNFMSARQYLAEFHLNHLSKMTQDTSDPRLQFIGEFTGELDAATYGVYNMLSHQEFMNTSLTETDKKKLIEKQMEAHKSALRYASELIDMLTDEIKRAGKTEPFYKPYIELLSNLQTCCLGIINRHARLIKQSEELKFSLDKLFMYFLELGTMLYDFTAASGGKYIPANQALDPLLGSRITDDEKYANDFGHCGGHTWRWAQQVASHGKARKFTAIDADTHFFQEKVTKKDLFKKEYPIETVSKILPQILKSISGDKIYKISLGVTGTSNHAVGARHIPGKNMIEFFDPNFGIFLLPKDKFPDFFKLWFAQYTMNGQTFKNFSVISMAEQKLVVENPEYDFETKSDDKFMGNQTTIEAYSNLFNLMNRLIELHVDLKNPSSNNKFLEHLQEGFLENMLTRVKYTKDIVVLNTLQNIFNPTATQTTRHQTYGLMRRALQQQPTSFSLFPGKQTTAPIDIINQALAKRIEVLNKNVKSI